MKDMYFSALERLAAYRSECHMTQEEVGKIIGVNQSQYSKMELGKTMLSYRSLHLLREHGWDVDYILTGCKYPEASKLNEYIDIEGEKQRDGMLKLLLWAIESIPSVTDSRYYKVCKMEKTLLEKQLYGNPLEKTTVMQKVRETMNYSQRDMALIMGVDIKKYRSMEWGDSMPDSELFVTLYNRTGCRPTVLMDGKVNGKWLLSYFNGRIGEKGRERLKEVLKLGASIYGNGAEITKDELRQLQIE